MTVPGILIYANLIYIKEHYLGNLTSRTKIYDYAITNNFKMNSPHVILSKYINSLYIYSINYLIS